MAQDHNGSALVEVIHLLDFLHGIGEVLVSRF
jgi:hypothetical protein